jgi:hypothetical protein
MCAAIEAFADFRRHRLRFSFPIPRRPSHFDGCFAGRRPCVWHRFTDRPTNSYLKPRWFGAARQRAQFGIAVALQLLRLPLARANPKTALRAAAGRRNACGAGAAMVRAPSRRHKSAPMNPAVVALGSALKSDPGCPVKIKSPDESRKKKIHSAASLNPKGVPMVRAFSSAFGCRSSVRLYYLI